MRGSAGSAAPAGASGVLSVSLIADEEQTLDLIYSAAVQPSLWPQVTDRIIALTGGVDGSISQLDTVKGTGSAVMSSRGDPEVLERYFAYFYNINPLQLVSDPVAYAKDWTPKILLDEEILPRETLERTEFYNDFTRSIGAEFGMVIRLGLSGSTVAAMNVGRPLKRGRFTRSEIAVAARLQRHLVRAYAMTETFAGLKELNAGLIEALNHTSSAMLLLDGGGRILHVNGAAERLLSAGDPLQACGGRLTARDPVAAQGLAALIGGAGADDWKERRSATLPLPRRDDRSPLPLILTASPLRLESASAFVHGSAVLVSVKDPAETQREPSRFDQFTLTQAERRLAATLCDGLSLREASDRHAISFNTARAQLAAVFAKTGTRRQLDLVRLLTAG